MNGIRPYIRFGINDLWELYSSNSQNDEMVKEIEYELQYRGTKSATALKTTIKNKKQEYISSEIQTENIHNKSSNGISLYPWQEKALKAWEECGHVGVVEAVTGAGKTHVALSAMLDHLENDWKVVVVVPSIALQEQWYKKIDFIINETLSNNYKIRLMGGLNTTGLIVDYEYDVLIAVAGSAYKYAMNNPNKKGLIICDECHRYGGKNWSRVLEPGFDRRLGLTATYDREDRGIDDYLNPYFKKVCYSLGYKEALQDDVIAKFRIAYIGVEFNVQELAAYEEADSECRKLRSKLINQYGVSPEPFGAYIKEVTNLSAGGNEDKQVTKIARRYLNFFSKRRAVVSSAVEKIECLKKLAPSIEAADRTIIFSQTKDTAEQAVDALLELDLNAKVLDATMSIKERKAVFADFENGDEDIVAAPMLLDEGVDVPSADLAIILASSRSSRQMIQRMGRVLRKKEDGRLARVAILYVKGTMEDPAMGAHETFIDKIRDAASYEDTFEGNDYLNICDFLNDWDVN